jgi:hypothetical protein
MRRLFLFRNIVNLKFANDAFSVNILKGAQKYMCSFYFAQLLMRLESQDLSESF